MGIEGGEGKLGTCVGLNAYGYVCRAKLFQLQCKFLQRGD